MSESINEDAVRFEDIRRTYVMGTQEVHALAGVSARFAKGAFWAIMGPSGSGKSTMLNILGCLDRPTGGRYFLNGQDISSLDDNELSDIRLKYLGFIFQSFNLIAQLTVEENIALPLYYLGWTAERSSQRARELAAMVGLEKRRALANDPVFLLADEPTGNLDSSTSIEIIALLEELNRGGKTIIMVTHEPDIAKHASKRLYMHDGLIARIEG